VGSLVIGYCICSQCGYTDNKFNWHTYFRCPNCGSTHYVKPDLWGENNEEESAKMEIGSFSYMLVADNNNR